MAGIGNKRRQMCRAMTIAKKRKREEEKQKQQENFFERFWCGAKWYTRENCEYTWESLKKNLPLALDSVSTATIHRYYKHCVRTLDAYIEGCTYGTREFTDSVYRGYRQVVDKSKW
jgi:hypothetical protein